MEPETPFVGRSKRQAVTVLGRVVEVSHLDRVFWLRCDSGEEARCLLVEGDIEAVAALTGQMMVVCGMAIYYLNEHLDRIEVDRCFPDDGNWSFWAHIPRPMYESELAVSDPEPRPWGLAAIIGKWPGDETDEEIDELLREMS